MKIYHGSTQVVTEPKYGIGRTDNDYGQGFYCTKDSELAKEWAAVSADGGFCSCYELKEKNLSILWLKDRPLLSWVALLLKYRRLRISSPVEMRAREYLITHFLPDISDYDVVAGYRADDSYFSFSRAFLSNTITLEQLVAAMHLGNLGEQVVLKSRAAFSAIRFCGCEPVSGAKYYPMRRMRDQKAREDYRRMLENADTDGQYISDIMRKG
ncbi:MAG: DUF3990 domain-containing protein [Lachnospiraceae bacterium]|nr:DUF3990 domain-containing protein [Lachnospiraceae bacterium]